MGYFRRSCRPCTKQNPPATNFPHHSKLIGHHDSHRDGWVSTLRSLPCSREDAADPSQTQCTISATSLAARTYRAEVPRTSRRVGRNRVEVLLSDREADRAPPPEPCQGFPGPLCLCRKNQCQVLSGSLPANRVTFST